MQSPFGKVSGLEVRGVVQSGQVETVKLSVQLKYDSGLNSVYATLKGKKISFFSRCATTIFCDCDFLIVFINSFAFERWRQIRCRVARRRDAGLHSLVAQGGHFSGICPLACRQAQDASVYCGLFSASRLGATSRDGAPACRKRFLCVIPHSTRCGRGKSNCINQVSGYSSRRRTRLWQAFTRGMPRPCQEVRVFR